MHPQCLPNAQVKHDLFASTRNRIAPHISVQPLDFSALSASAVTESAKDLRGLSRAEFKGRSRLGLQARDGAAKLEHRFRLVHGLGLVYELLEPGGRSLNLASHVGKLEADDGMVDEWLAKGAAFMGILHGLFVADAGETEALNDDADAFVVEVGHNYYRSCISAGVMEDVDWSCDLYL